LSRKIPRPLDAVEVRVLGSLLEKEQTNPETSPLTVNALIAACNQKTNREPVMQLSEDQIVRALEVMRQDVLVWRTDSARAERWQQSVVRRWALDHAGKALMTLLLLRGPQTTGELRSRSERLHTFGSLGEVEAALAGLAGGEDPLVRELPRRPGQKETRFVHLVGEVAESEPAAFEEAPEAAHSRPSLAERLERLEEIVAGLANDVAELKSLLS
jgi:uncharacterized protein YceH (UPF0502 family)